MPTTIVSVAAHIWLDKRGVAWIDDTNTKVIEVALDMIALGWSPEEIHFQHPHLSLGQIHAALAFYFDHQDQADAEIERRYRRVQILRTKGIPPFSRKRLLARLNKP